MKWYLYIFSVNNGKLLHVGFTSDILRMVKFYKSFPNMYNLKDFNKLVYIEGPEVNVLRIEARYNEVFAMDREKKDLIIDHQNPQRIELLPGVNIEI